MDESDTKVSNLCITILYHSISRTKLYDNEDHVTERGVDSTLRTEWYDDADDIEKRGVDSTLRTRWYDDEDNMNERGIDRASK
jgi:hypothetical protein